MRQKWWTDRRLSILMDLILWLALCGGVSWLFYQSWWAFLALVPAFPLFLKYRMKSLEISFRNARKDLEIYGQGHAMIQQEFTRICQQMDKNIPLETSLADMAKRSGDEDIRQFAEILILAKRSGGGVIQMIRESMERIQRRIETNYEIDAMLSAKKSEFRMMCLIPAGIILYMKLFSTGFMAALYHNAGGVLFMSVCLAAYLAGIFWGRKILDIPV